MKLFCIIIFFVITLALFVYLPIVVVAPNGVDVENAILIRSEVEKILKASGSDSTNGRNVTMMEVKKEATAVAIKDAFPSVDVVHALIEKNRGKITAGKFSVIFLDRKMVEITRFEFR